MGHFTLVAFTAVLFSLFVESEANPFVYNYEGLKIGGLIFTGLLIAGGVSTLLSKELTKVKSDNTPDKPVSSRKRR